MTGNITLPRLRVPAVVLLALALGCGGSEPRKVLRIGDQAPSFALPALSGETVANTDFAGDPVIVNFWATWCQPCLKELPILNQLSDDGVRVVAIALDEEGARVVEPFVAEHRLAYTILLGDQEIFQRFTGFTIPFTLVLDGSWTVVGVHRGAAEREDLLADLESI